MQNSEAFWKMRPITNSFNLLSQTPFPNQILLPQHEITPKNPNLLQHHFNLIKGEYFYFMADNKEKSVGELVSLLAEKTGLSKAQTKSFLDSYAEVLTEELHSTGSVQVGRSW